VDAALQRQNSFRSSPTDYRHFSIGSIAHLAQLFVMYQTSYVHKSTDEWRVTGTFECQQIHTIFSTQNFKVLFFCIVCLYVKELQSTMR
jgi:hypothetical protein